MDAAEDHDRTNGIYPDRLVIALTAPLSGPSRLTGERLRAGLEARLAQIARAGGLHGRRIELRSYDNRGELTAALATLREIADRRHIFALVASVGGDVSQLSFVAEDSGVLLFHAGADRQRGDPGPHVFALRTSLDGEADALVRYLTEVRQPSLPASNIALFAAGDDSGDLGPGSKPTVDALAGALKQRAGLPSSSLRWASYARGSDNVQAAAQSLLKWLGGQTLSVAEDGTTTAAIVLAGEAQPAALLVKTVRDELVRLRSGRGTATNPFELTLDESSRLAQVQRLIFSALSDADPHELTAQLRERGTYARDQLGTAQRHCSGTVLTQVVPDPSGDSPGAQAYRDDMAATNATIPPNAAAFEGHIIARLLEAGLQRHGTSEIDVESFIGTLEQLESLDLGLGSDLGLGPKRHRASQTVWGSLLDWDCARWPLALDSRDAAAMAQSGALCRADTCVLAGEIEEDLRLDAGHKWRLRGTVTVGNGSAPVTLTIEPGTTLLGEEATRGTLAVQRLARLVADGQANAPIVFTSSRPPSQRRRGDWAGLVINGRAPINACGGAAPPCRKSGPLATGSYGGDVINDDSGVLRYVRVEFAGRYAGALSTLGGLVLRGAGRKTVVDRLQVHASGRDGLALAGGTVNLRHVLLTGAAGYGLHWTEGWTGSAQYVASLQYADAGEGGLDGTNGDAPAAAPRSLPRMSNVTLVGSPRSQRLTTGLLLRGGTAAMIHNTIVVGWQGACFDIDDEQTFRLAYDETTNRPTQELLLSTTILSCSSSFREQSADLVPLSGLVFAWPRNRAANPLLRDPFNAGEPDFRPGVGSPALDSALPTESIELLGGPFFEPVKDIGAFDQQDDWTAEWTTTDRH